MACHTRSVLGRCTGSGMVGRLYQHHHPIQHDRSRIPGRVMVVWPSLPILQVCSTFVCAHSRFGSSMHVSIANAMIPARCS